MGWDAWFSWQWHPHQHYYARVCWKSLSGHWASLRPHRWVSFLCRPGKHLTWPIGYVIIWVQVDGVQGNDEEQIALLVPDLSNFVAWVPVILRTPTIGHIMNVIKEGEINTLVTPWVNAHVAHLLAVWWVTTTLEDDKVTTRVLDSTEYNEVVTTKGSKMIDAFSSRITHAQTKTTFTSARLNVMTNALCADKEPLTQGLTIQNAYTKLHNGSKNVTIMVRNSMAYPQNLKEKNCVERVVVANWVPKPQMWPSMIDALDEAQSIQTQKLTQSKGRKSCSRSWIWVAWDLGHQGWQIPTHSLLAEYHDIFSLEPCELSCTHSTEHVIKVTNAAPFKEQFRWIPPLLEEEVCTHLWEMLDSGAIHPSQSAWCNAVVLVQKKDRNLHFCIDFHHLNACTEEGLLPIAKNPKRHLKVWLAQAISHAWTLVQILADQFGQAVKPVHCICHWKPGLL